MKVLYISVFRDGTGYSHAALNYLLAMDQVGIDVVPRNIKLSNYNSPVPKRFLELENKSDKNCDVCIQHILPSMMEFNGNYKNIGLFAWETSGWPKSIWTEKLNLMDECWVINEYMKEVCINSGVKIPIKVVPHCINTDKYKQTYKQHSIIKEKRDFVFYTIAEAIKRKNLITLIQAYYLEFDPIEPVQLIIKTNNEGFIKIVDEIGKGLKLYNDDKWYKKPLIVTQRLQDEQIDALHESCDCFVSTSFGEAWSIPTMDAIGFGKTPIVPNSTGFKDYVNNDIGWLIDTQPIPVFGAVDSLPELYSSNEKWFLPSLDQTRQYMREAYANSKLRTKKTERCISYIENYSYTKIGSHIKDILNEQ